MLSLRLLIGLIFCNFIWSAHPAMAKLVLADFNSVQAAWLRFTTALLAYFGLFAAFRLFASSRLPARPLLFPGKRVDRVLLVLLGVITFFFAPLFHMSGLSATSAIDGALLTAMEPLAAVFLAWLFLREKLKPVHRVAFALSLTGFFLLSGLTWDRLFIGWDQHLIGNMLFVAALVGEATYSVLGRKLVSRYSPILIFGTALTVGVGLLTLALLARFGVQAIPRPDQFTWKSVFALLWLGPVGTTITYCYWMIALVNAPVASVALTLFVQPIIGAVAGYVLLQERLSAGQALGGTLILGALVVISFSSRWYSFGIGLQGWVIGMSRSVRVWQGKMKNEK